MSLDLGPLQTAGAISGCSILGDGSTIMCSINVSFDEHSLRENARIKLSQSSTHLLASRANDRTVLPSADTQSIYGPILRTDQWCCSHSYSPSRKYLVSFFEATNRVQLEETKPTRWMRVSRCDATGTPITIEVDHGPFYFQSKLCVELSCRPLFTCTIMVFRRKLFPLRCRGRRIF